MSSAVQAARPRRALHLFEATIVKKAIMAVTGAVLFAFVTGHLLGNLQVFLGPERLNAYAALLKANAEILWGVRSLLLVCVLAHIIVTIQLAKLKMYARPIGYQKKNNAHSSVASRSMYITGPMIAAFVIYHLLHLTTGAAHPHFSESDVYSNVVYGFSQVPASIAYIVAVGLLCLHLNHGIYSMFQSLGYQQAQHLTRVRRAAQIISILYFAGYASIPLAVLTGVVRLSGMDL
jgi:succinate dehydrogenase / fumarate reductase cytochrome b subunit